MFDRSELKVLAAWCRNHDLSWMPSGSEDAGATLVLQPHGSCGAWERMLLIPGEDGYTLVTEDGQTLASASDLPALLDALDGGVAEPVESPVRSYYAIGAGLAVSHASPSLRYVV
jgi:hypothetical protein